MKNEATVRFARLEDLSQLKAADWLSNESKILEKIERNEIIVIDEAGQITGLLRYSWFWDYLPFINLIWVEEGFRREGRATRLIQRLEEASKGINGGMILASTQSDEDGQKFFRKVGFIDSGGFAMKGQAFELIMIKYIDK
jgi:N-acetylglutamate synthase-like GNAT family acetyltransferase